MMKVISSNLPDCYEIMPPIFKDQRGCFVKIFNVDVFSSLGLQTVWAEEYYTVSSQGVLRGMHFQLPPHDHEKIVYCTSGAAMDVVLDLRLGSPTYGKFHVFEVSAEKGNVIYIPRGMAHGFYARSNNTTMNYKVSSVYSATSDCGLLWNSAAIPWPDNTPLVSERDCKFVSFVDFESPFVFSSQVS